MIIYIYIYILNIITYNSENSNNEILLNDPMIKGLTTIKKNGENWAKMCI